MTIDEETSLVTVQRLGSITTSGVLVVSDFGYDVDDTLPLNRSIAAGTYPVEVSEAFGRNVALRIVVAPGDPVAWHPADSGEGHVLGSTRET